MPSPAGRWRAASGSRPAAWGSSRALCSPSSSPAGSRSERGRRGAGLPGAHPDRPGRRRLARGRAARGPGPPCHATPPHVISPGRMTERAAVPSARVRYTPGGRPARGRGGGTGGRQVVPGEIVVPGPQSTAFFVLLMVIFAALVCWLVLAKHIVFRVLAACLAFIPAVVFGIAAVNKYYDYYQNWNSAIADFSSQPGPVAGIPGVRLTSVRGITRLIDGNYAYTRLAAQDGFTLRVVVHGRLSHLTRNVYVYLPPQYFQAAYRHYRFPVIELIHGFPGEPQDWITVLDITSTLRGLIAGGLAKPAVLVMPDANGARGVSLQCLNQVHGPQDATFLAQDVPNFIARSLRVWPPGRAWGIAGYSEGGFCAANLGIQYGSRFGFAGVLSGYFTPMRNQLGHPARLVDPFGHDNRLRARNTPTTELLRLPPGALVPQFWIGAGAKDPGDVRAAEIFRQIVQLRQPAVVLKLVPSGGHTMLTWRLLVTPMLVWMTPRLATNVHLAQERARRLARATATPRPRQRAVHRRRRHARRPSPSPAPRRTAG